MADLSGVVVGGLLAIAGSSFSQWHLHKLKRDDTKRLLKANKLEQLITAVYEFDHWMNLYSNNRAYGEETAETPNPFAKVQSIIALYFRELTELSKELESSANNLQIWVLEAGKKRISGNISKLGEGHSEVAKPYVFARENLLTAIQDVSTALASADYGVPSDTPASKMMRKLSAIWTKRSA